MSSNSNGARCAPRRSQSKSDGAITVLDAAAPLAIALVYELHAMVSPDVIAAPAFLSHFGRSRGDASLCSRFGYSIPSCIF